MEYWKNLWKKSFDERRYRVALHIIFWLFYFIAYSFWEYYLLKIIGWQGSGLAVNWAISMLLNIIIITGSFYLTIRTTYWLLAKKHRYGWSFLTLILNAAVFCGLLYGAGELMELLLANLGILNGPVSQYASSPFGHGFLFVVEAVISYFALLCLPVAAKFFRDQLRHQKRESDLQKQNVQLQMDFLKAQIHPHFLFNTLNNIYSLNLDAEPEKASKMISRLSSLLRYVLYKGEEEFITLLNEMEMLQDFIQLEAVRTDNLDLTFDKPDEVGHQIFLPPFLLLPLVENAFKHGVNSQLNCSFIKINLSIKQNHILLEVANSFDEDYREANTKGLGLANLRKRLEYYYSEAFALTTTERENKFTATLKIPLQCPKYSA